MRRLDGRLLDGRVVRLSIEAGRIAAVEPAGTTGSVPLVLPGLVDLQVNGFAGSDVNAADVSVRALGTLTAELRRHGVTAYCPTIVTAGRERIVETLRVIARARAEDPEIARAVVGVHVEGPYLAAADGPRGAHDPGQLRDPDVDELAAWVAAAPGLVRIVTLAPERPGAEAYIRAATAAGLVVSIGHTEASPEQIRAAARAGARLSTHLGNGMHQLVARHPNQLWAQLAEDALVATFIADGHHLPADTFTAMVRSKGPGRAALVSDSAALAGCAPGDYRTPVGGAVTVWPDGSLRLTGSDLLAGSARSLLDCVRWARRESPFPLAELWAMASAVPAGVLGLDDRGVVRPGASADLVLADDDLAVLDVLVAGTET